MRASRLALMWEQACTGQPPARGGMFYAVSGKRSGA